MYLISKITVALTLVLYITSCSAQMKNSRTENVKIFGNCGMCESTIETAGNQKKIAQVDWNKETKMATLVYDTTKTNRSEILKRIALAGYDSDEFLAPDDVYAKLPACCKYERANKTAAAQEEIIDSQAGHDKGTGAVQKASPLKPVFDGYFLLKDALVSSDGKLAAARAKDVLSAMNDVKMDQLGTDEHAVWMKLLSHLKSDTEKISATNDLEKQRNAFMELSGNFRVLLQVSKQETAIYYQHCPMYNDGKGADWLSKNNSIKNPYYGAQMLTCGKTIETIK
ncbi:MAG: mercury transporter [Bacteroidetes bacterium RIFCSPHIGHO2_02_FULL_44_7]|nr:MAG: mercury transporter [Bacteroidetes bacterium RIFCSPHIGHO2_02_FULL_44_7]